MFQHVLSFLKGQPLSFWSLGLFGFILAYPMRPLKLVDIIHLVERNKVDSSLWREGLAFPRPSEEEMSQASVEGGDA